jgi:hypothetical protein
MLKQSLNLGNRNAVLCALRPVAVIPQSNPLTRKFMVAASYTLVYTFAPVGKGQN